jgi:hemerythrin-like metal-binding protein
MSGFRIPWIEGVDLSSSYFDDDHHALLEKFNALLSAIASKDPTSVAEATKALREVATEHFENEERRMRECEYHALPKHSASHRMLLEDLADLQKKIGLTEGACALTSESAFLEQWLVPHLTTDDKQFSEFLSAREYLLKASPT